MVERTLLLPRVGETPKAKTPDKPRIFSEPQVMRPEITLASGEITVSKSKTIKRKAPALWHERAQFLPETAEFFRRCGVDPERVNPIPIGEGFTNIAFFYIAPEGTHRVVKIARRVSKGFMSTGYEQDVEDIALVKKYFGSYALPTEVRKDPQTGNWVIIQDMVRGKVLTSTLETPGIRAQLVDMARLNREMMRQTGHCLDFVGLPGMLTWLRHQFRAIVTRKSVFDVSNIMVDTSGNLKIIDETLLRLTNIPAKQRAISNVGLIINSLLMRLYFGVDLQP